VFPVVFGLDVAVTITSRIVVVVLLLETDGIEVKLKNGEVANVVDQHGSTSEMEFALAETGGIAFVEKADEVEEQRHEAVEAIAGLTFDPGLPQGSVIDETKVGLEQCDDIDVPRIGRDMFG
jgi:hypothetical protein